ncbi:MAG: PQQ-binding-like beta-propeller repeat protein, partial [Planctomycetales bacterium]|nr:PQQ-binding-like beta-propeller repeat protein [Planctomycetales bacterium]
IVLGLLAPRLVGAEPSVSNRIANWHQWRGPLGTGEAPDADPPSVWKFAAGESQNITWKVKIPGKGHSTPIVSGDLIFVATAVPVGEEFAPRYSSAPGAHDNAPVTQAHEFVVVAVDRSTGTIRWKKTVNSTIPHEGAHISASLASGSPISDGERVYAFFGSHGLYCLNFDGDVLWSKSFGPMSSKHGHGEGSSPAIHGKSIVVNWDHEKQSFITSLDSKTGEENWRQNRDEVTSWSSPLIYEHAGVHQVIVPGTRRIRSYDLRNGRLIWECGGLSANVVATPVAADGMVYVASSYDTRKMMGIRLEGARGDITDTDQVVWSRRQRTPYVPSPLLYKGTLYFLRHYQGIMSRVEAKSGEERFAPFRLGPIRNVYSSPIAAQDRIYVSDLDGITVVFSHGEIPRLIAVNTVGEPICASLVAVGKELYIRGETHLFRIETSSE